MPRGKPTNPDDDRIQLRLGRKLKLELVELCKELDTSLSQVARNCLTDWKKKEKAKLRKEQRG